MGEWEFFRVPGGVDDPPYLWSWRCTRHDGAVVSTGETFRFFLDCVAHARLHGYKGGPLHTRREPPYAPSGRATRESGLRSARSS